jgi:hypothetical protein
MPEKRTTERARRAKRQGKAATTQAGEFVREEMHHKKQGRHSRGNTKQAIAIGLSKARRAGVKVGAPKKGKASAATRKKAKRDIKAGARSHRKRTTAKRSASQRSSSGASHRKSTSRKSSSRKSASHRSTARRRSR